MLPERVHDSTTRFSDRVENYVRYRPTYPVEVLDLLARECGWEAGSIVADVGSGTGISSRLFLEAGNVVYGIEPNAEMRQAAERLFANESRFTSLDATAEATGLHDDAVDFIVAGQAFHWFDREKCRPEFERILRPAGWLVLIWNERLTDTTPFLRGYEALLANSGTDYTRVNHTAIPTATLDEFFLPQVMRTWSTPNRQVFDREGLRGRALSSSYTPNIGHPRHDEFMRRLDALFHEHAEAGCVAFEYQTRVYYGRLAASQSA